MTTPTELAERLEARGHWVSIDLRVREKSAAELLGVKQRTMRAWREEGVAPRVVRVSGRITYYLSDLIELIEKSTSKTGVRCHPVSSSD